jgi:hypothetical protein
MPLHAYMQALMGMLRLPRIQLLELARAAHAAALQFASQEGKVQE